jgi:hypothetical protein
MPFLPGFPLGSLPRERDPKVMKFFIMSIPEFVLDVVCRVLVGCLEEFLEVVCQRPRLALETALSGRDVLLVRVNGGGGRRGCDPMKAPLLPLLATIGVFLGALDSDI